MTEAKTLDDWDVLAVEDKGLYIRGDEDAWLVVKHEKLEGRQDDLAQRYREAIE